MKTAFILCSAAALTAVSALACPDFSGTFSGDNGFGEVETTKVTQHGCESVTIESDINGKQDWVLDGVERTVGTGNGYQISEKNSWSGDSIVSEEHVIAMADHSDQGTVTQVYALTGSGDVSISMTVLTPGNPAQTLPAHIYHRQ